MFAIGGKVSGFELFDSPDTLKKLWPKLKRQATGSMRLTGRALLVKRGKSQVLTWAQTTWGSSSRKYRRRNGTVRRRGRRTHIASANTGVTGAALTARGRVIHLSAFAM